MAQKQLNGGHTLLAFTQMGVRFNSGSDLTLGKDVTGVYFGMELLAILSVNGQDIQVMQFSKHIAEIVIEHRVSRKSGKVSLEEEAWSAETEDWLRKTVGESAALQFRASIGIDNKKKDLLALNQRLFTLTKQQ